MDCWSYLCLVEEFRLVGVLGMDCIEFFGCMVFNVVCGNDDDYVCNYVIVYVEEECCWCFVLVFDVVLNLVDMFVCLYMQLLQGCFDILCDVVLVDVY